MYRKSILLASALVGAASAQQVGTNTAETHPSLTTYKCTKAGGCVSQAQSIVLDANWRWLHTVGGYTNCYTGNTWNTTICSDPTTCATNCAVDGADYSGTYGITTSGNALTLKFVTKGSGTNIGSRVYLMQSDSAYQMFNLKNQEFTFDVDTSNLPCGLNGALYLIEMDQDGGMAKYPTNKAGAKYGTGYCDTQCPHDLKFINGEANVLDWTPSSNDVNAGSGRYGTCCNEMDIWEANSISAAYTPHVCSVNGQYRCEGTECGDGAERYEGVCDKDGCDFNSYRMGNTTFYGPGKTINTNSKITVVTQFITSDGTATGALTEIRRKYVVNGVVYENSQSNIAGITQTNKITDAFCVNQKTVFGDTNTFTSLGGLTDMGDSLATGMVLALSLWDDHASNMLWLDSTFPTDSTKLGAARGTCATTSGVPSDLETNHADASVTYSNIRWGDLDSTYTGTTGSGSSSSTLVTRASSASSTARASSTSAGASTTSAAAGTVAKWGQCGGIGYTGPTTCVAGTTCSAQNAWYSQCL